MTGEARGSLGRPNLVPDCPGRDGGRVGSMATYCLRLSLPGHIEVSDFVKGCHKVESSSWLVGMVAGEAVCERSHNLYYVGRIRREVLGRALGRFRLGFGSD
ncbi:MAG: hypothetical protein CVT49_15550 [candidate division Zixibacteria bacterium HGW-Zixibacteria-1]|nr:MAG: hypothetical protein CVT49_15550 [candidate division Zixibacteria bacterium HGW-Zixibacteria-1]